MDQIRFNANELIAAYRNGTFSDFIQSKISYLYGCNHAFYTKLLEECLKKLKDLLGKYEQNPESRPGGASLVVIYITPPRPAEVGDCTWEQSVTV